MKYNKWEQYIDRNWSKISVLDLDIYSINIRLLLTNFVDSMTFHPKVRCSLILDHSEFLPLCVCSFLTMYLHKLSPVHLDVPTVAAETVTAESDADTTGSKTLSYVLYLSSIICPFL